MVQIAYFLEYFSAFDYIMNIIFKIMIQANNRKTIILRDRFYWEVEAEAFTSENHT